MRETLEWACKKEGTKFVKVIPQYTSQRCCACGNVDSESRKSQSEYDCVSCGNTMHADQNAAVNVSVLGSATAGLAVVKQEDVACLFGPPLKEPPARGRLMTAQSTNVAELLVSR